MGKVMRWPRGASFNIFHFFFQAEDGIRDTSVTGVQTCALPISESMAADGQWEDRSGCVAGDRTDAGGFGAGVCGAWEPGRRTEIGRASCRERVKSSVVGVSNKKTAKYQRRAPVRYPVVSRERGE